MPHGVPHKMFNTHNSSAGKKREEKKSKYTGCETVNSDSGARTRRADTSSDGSSRGNSCSSSRFGRAQLMLPQEHATPTFEVAWGRGREFVVCETSNRTDYSDSSGRPAFAKVHVQIRQQFDFPLPALPHFVVRNFIYSPTNARKAG